MLTVPQFAVKLVIVTAVAALATGAEGAGEGVGVGVNVAVAVGVAVGLAVGVNVAVAVGVAVGLAVGVDVAVGVGVGVGRGLGALGAAERLPSTIKPHAPAAIHAIAMSRLILRKKGLVVIENSFSARLLSAPFIRGFVRSLCFVSPDAGKRPAPREENTIFH